MSIEIIQLKAYLNTQNYYQVMWIEFRERIAELIDEGVLDKEDNVCVVVGGSNE